MKILLIHHGSPTGGDLGTELREFGHVVRVASSAADGQRPWTDFRPDVIVVRLETDSAAALDLVAAVTTQRALVGAPILVTGANEVAITAARRRFPDASFCRPDAVHTSIASIEAEE